MKTDKNWWKHFFNDIYLTTDARSVCNSALTKKETTLVEKTLKFKKNDSLLDLCGGSGRHSLELAKRGYCDITVLDYSPHLVNLGRKQAKKYGLSIKFKRKDARFTGLKSSNYSAVFVMSNSFGYFQDEKDNLRILKEIYRLLKKGGKTLLDLTDPDYVRRRLKPFSWHKADKDTTVYRNREVKGNLIRAREVVVSKTNGILRDGSYCERLYNKRKIRHLLKTAGFKGISIKNNLSLHKKQKDYGFLTQRMFVTACKS
ncbi:MAG: class I SAM-dependent methyltransferase [Candidatus Omnitrophica bacterium]|nr:class I SAM-dependent methyltransferase [Candidatus Omnitrophota bacterium]